MPHYSVRYVNYSTGGRRNHATSLIDIIPPSGGNLTAGDDFSVPLFESLPCIGGDGLSHFAFSAVSGSDTGNLLNFNPVTQHVEVGDADINVLVVYYPCGNGGTGDGVFIDAFNLDLAQFSDSDFVEIFSNNVLDPTKTFNANEYGTVSTTAADRMKSFEIVDGVDFLNWTKLGGVSSVDRDYQLSVDERGFIFAFYEKKPILPPPTIPDLDVRFGWIYVSPGVKVDGGGFVIGPRGPAPVGPWGGWFVKTILSISRFFNKQKVVDQETTKAATAHLNTISKKLIN